MSHFAEVKDICYEDSPKVVMARVVGTDSAAITQATLTAVSYIVKSYASRDDAENDVSGTSVIAETALAVSNVVYDSLQTDNDWRVDSLGYNFKHTIPAAAFPTKGLWYRYEVWADPVSGDDFLAVLLLLKCRATARD